MDIREQVARHPDNLISAAKEPYGYWYKLWSREWSASRITQALIRLEPSNSEYGILVEIFLIYMK